jgi:predicted ribosome quality control (RQC) complex YloA/Tae2 family protein
MIKKFSTFTESKKDKFPNLKKLEIDGYQIIMGKDALSNDHLTTIMADSEDLWFHVKGVPGSHIIIRQKDRLISNEVKRKVAELAAKNSKAKGDCVVVCCKAKFVKKDSDMNPGQVRVDYKNAEEINITI